MLVGIAELELLFGQFKVQIQHIVGSGDAVGCPDAATPREGRSISVCKLLSAGKKMTVPD